MSDRVQHGRIEKSPGKPRQYDRSLQKKAFARHKQGYNFRPTEENRRRVPENKDRYFFNFSKWDGSSIKDLAHDWSGESFLADFVLGEKFDLEGRPDLITAFRSLDIDFYNDDSDVGQKVLERGFTRTVRGGSHFYSSRLAEVSRVLLSCDETKYDQFIHVTHPPSEHWTVTKTASFGGDEETPDVTLDTVTFDNTIFSKLDDAEREELARFPVHISFHGMPIRLERLFIDKPDKKATYLTIAPLGFDSSSTNRHPHYLTMRLNEEGQDDDWAEKLLGIPHHFFGVYVNSETEDLTCAHIKPIQASEIEAGFRFEAHGNVVYSMDLKSGMYHSGV
ncbi:hypothetical protein J4E85_003804 [Alternaria conjuncta]|uniref:uncharacterized protein n=1 Tax=Alternaria conjuncta TaxID=181017 RepID=UPI00221F55C4|nr:uncharacterized protein J4E85_003804 [Alternaria conjuncta]KAI4931214.1 hypothetical protein J4E85_003804 [Alternaria conjuncta]